MEVPGFRDTTAQTNATQHSPITFVRSFDTPGLVSFVIRDDSDTICMNRVNGKPLHVYRMRQYAMSLLDANNGALIRGFDRFRGNNIVFANKDILLAENESHKIDVISMKNGEFISSIKCSKHSSEEYYKHFAYADKRIVLTYYASSYNPSRVVVKNLETGSFISVKPNGILRFQEPTYVCTAKEGGRYVAYVVDSASNFETNLVTKISMDGEVLGAFNDWPITSPGPITATGDGRVLMLFENSIRVLPPPLLGKSHVLLPKNQDIGGISSIQFNPKTNKLYVGCIGKIHVFELNLAAIQ